jgi:uncharacterized membrane protein
MKDERNDLKAPQPIEGAPEEPPKEEKPTPAKKSALPKIAVVIVALVAVAVLVLVMRPSQTPSTQPGEQTQWPTFEAKWVAIDFTVYNDNRATIENVQLLDNGMESYTTLGDYSVFLLNQENQTLFEKPFTVSFLIMSEPPIEVDNVPFRLILPYTDSTKKIEIRLDNQVLATRTIS